MLRIGKSNHIWARGAVLSRYQAGDKVLVFYQTIPSIRFGLSGRPLSLLTTAL